MVESVQGLNEKYGAAVRCLWRVTKLWASGGGRGRIPSQPFPALPVVSQTEGSCERAKVLTSAASQPQAELLTLFTLALTPL